VSASYVTDILDTLGDENIVCVDDFGLFWMKRQRRFAVNCNDWFAWACADLEIIEAEDIPLLQRSMAEASAAEEDEWGLRLFATRKRGLPPQEPWFRSSGYVGSTTFIPEALEPAFRLTHASDQAGSHE
jgi:hypothetical protein